MSVSGMEYAFRRALPLSQVRQIAVMSGRLTMIRFQQSAESLDTDDLTLMAFMLGVDAPVETLVNPLVMIVLEVLG